MQDIYIEPTDKSPSIKLKFNEGLIEIIGRSLMNNPIGFYEPLEKWISDYSKQTKSNTVVNFSFEYFNTSTSKWIISLVKKLQTLYDRNLPIEMNWIYEDDDILEYGEVLQDLTDIEIIMKRVEDISY